MTRLMLLAALAAVVGCGDGKYEAKPLTDDQKKQVQEDDRRVTEEESGGKGYGQKTKAKK